MFDDQECEHDPTRVTVTGGVYGDISLVVTYCGICTGLVPTEALELQGKHAEIEGIKRRARKRVRDV